MATKRCGGCGRRKPLSAFYVKHPTRGTRQSYCITCFAERHKRYYQNNKRYYIEKKKRLRATLIADVNAMKCRPCADCGQVFPHYVMDFDHRDPTTKIECVARLVAAGQRSQCFREIAKCDLVCANCHRIRTWNATHGGRGSVVDHSVVARG